MTYTLTTTPHRLDTPRTPADLATLIRAKRARIAALDEAGFAAAASQARAELAKLEGAQQ